MFPLLAVLLLGLIGCQPSTKPAQTSRAAESPALPPRIDAYYKLFQQNRYAEAGELLDSLMRQTPKTDTATWGALYFFGGMQAFFGGLSLEREHELTSRAVALLSRQDPYLLYGRALNNLALATRERGNLVQALQLATQSVRVNQKHPSKYLAGAQYNVGMIYKDLSIHPAAMRYFHSAINTDLRFDNEKGITYPLNEIGRLLLEEFEPQRSLSYFSRAYNIAKKAKDTTQMVGAILGLISAYDYMDQDSTALPLVKQCLRFVDRLAPLEQSIAYTELGTYFSNQNQTSRALALLQQGYALAQAQGSRLRQMDLTYSIGVAYFNAGQYDQSKAYLLTALAAAEQDSVHLTQKNLLHYLAQIDQHDGNYRQANERLKQYLSISHQLDSLNSRASFQAQQILFEMAEKETQIQSIAKEKKLQTTLTQREKFWRQVMTGAFFATLGLALTLAWLWRRHSRLAQQTAALLQQSKLQLQQLDQTTQEVQKTNEQLYASNRTKNELLAVVAHDLRAPLHAVAHLIEVHQRSADLSPQTQLVFFHSIANQFRALQNMADNILRWAIEQQQTILPIFRPIPLRPKLDQAILALSLLAEKKQVEIVYLTTPLPNPWIFTDEHILLILLNNLISNAIKYSPSGGQVALNICDEGPEVLFLIENSFLPEQLNATSDSAYLDEPTQYKLGMQILASFSVKVNATLSYQTPSENRVRAILSLPKPTIIQPTPTADGASPGGLQPEDSSVPIPLPIDQH